MGRCIDYSYSHFTGQVLNSVGVTLVGRYVPTGSAGKDLTNAEVNDLHSHGIGIFVFFETTATRAGGGKGAGYADGINANKAMDRLGYPKQCPIFYTVDYPVGDPRTLAPYFEGLKEAGGRPIGAYGQATVIAYLRTTLRVPYGVQSSAWSNGLLTPLAHVYQKNVHTYAIPGHANRDWDEDIVEHSFPWWGNSGVVNPPTSAPLPWLHLGLIDNHANGTVWEYQHAMNRVFPDYSRLALDGDYGPKTFAVTEEFQRRANVGIDGSVYIVTWHALAKYGVYPNHG